MKPNIDLHGIVSLRLTPTKCLERISGGPFATRDLIAMDAQGQEFRIGLFADRASQLAIDAEIDRAVEAVTSQPIFPGAERSATYQALKAAEDIPFVSHESAVGIAPAYDPRTGKEIPW